ncbi:MAG: DUF262 domain-containing HNH endonuclease family protein [Veillonella sp.]|jgi:hypothetical protein|uniref:DUF262 domain-containing protein n=1 Tax=Veillonella sp. TaxID=1926307 RepID=UPI00257FD574|nr:DUF262 domain-containing HNH endonuclease family protein [Veillonella sp.]MBS6863017.1 DUF262 domain-containing protein [Veillonella sp.]MDU7877944.1 DUF262 domain-containing HNH endonuclease family protein [Veillonella sp.]MDU7979828.1 DUF262 domain-containing HNH endonuclease family protein [Clostridioides difficile]
MAKITSEMQPLSQILVRSSDQFIIPDFQRAFVWTDEEANNLINDFMADTDNFTVDIDSLPGYLLGNIVLIKNNTNNSADVVDGQQRLTTLTLLFKAIFIALEELQKEKAETANKWYRVMADIDKAFQFLDNDDKFKGLRILHNSSLNFGETYKAIIKNENTLTVQSSSESDENLNLVFETLCDRVSEIRELGEKQFKNFIKYIQDKVMLIVTTADSKEKAFQLFEVLNNRGRSLEPMDLLKSNFMKILYDDEAITDPQKDEFNSNWNEFISVLSKQKIQTSTFTKHYILGTYGQNIKQDQLFTFFDKQPLTSKDILNLSQSLKHSAAIYSSIIKNSRDNSFSQSNNSFILFDLLKLKQMLSLLIPFYDSPDILKEKVLDLAVKYGASVLFSFTQTNQIEKELETALSKALKKYSDEDKYNEIKVHLNKRILENIKQLKALLPIRSFASPSGNANQKASLLLKFIELYFNDNVIILGPPKKIELEHIMPRSADAQRYQFSSDKEKAEFTNRIGNLTLLDKSANIAAKNKDFFEKKEYYEESDYKITSSIVEALTTAVNTGNDARRVQLQAQYQPQYSVQDLWLESNINERGQNIAKLLEFALTN